MSSRRKRRSRQLEEQEEWAAFEMCLEPAGHRRRQPK